MEVKIIKIHIQRISRRIKNLREEKNLTQEALAEQLGISRQSIISVEHGKCLPSLPLALRLADIFDLPLEKIFFAEEKETNQNFEKGAQTMPRPLMPWSPLRDLDNFFNEDWPYSGVPGRSARSQVSFPAVNVHQTEKEVIIEADIPGIKEDDLEIEVGDNFVTLRGERLDEVSKSEKNYLHREINYGTFERRLPLPTKVKTDQADATIKDGILKIKLLKLEALKPRVMKIKIKKA